MKQEKIWLKKNSYDKKKGSKSPPSYPNEMLIRLCTSKRFSKFPLNIFKKNFKVIEIGCFAGNNLRFFIENKVKCYGSEINNNMVNLCKENLKRFKIKTPIIKIGTNENIDYKKNFFDLLVSINTIHYSYKNGLIKAVEEYSRVLKKGGIAIIETPKKNHTTVNKSQFISDFHFKWGPKGFRKYSDMGFVNNEKKFVKILKKYFRNVETNYKIEKYAKFNISNFVFVCQK